MCDKGWNPCSAALEGHCVRLKVEFKLHWRPQGAGDGRTMGKQ